MSSVIALVFPGQGSQRAGMLDAVPETDSLDRLLDAAEALTGENLRTLAAEGPSERLAETTVAQPLLFLADWAWGRSLLDAGIEPAFLAGHSLGEFAALALSGAFSVEAGLELVVERSRLMARAAQDSPGGMAAVLGTDPALVSSVVAGLSEVWTANDNAADQIILSGTHRGLDKAVQALSEAGARKIITLKVAGAFHSPLMKIAADDFEALLEKAAFCDATTPVLQNSEPAPTTDATAIKERLSQQMTSPVRWTETMTELRRLGVTMIAEAGPGAVLKGLARRYEGIKAISVEDSGIGAVLQEVD